jgi:5-methylcytosine-specific restriction endonuclease McrA
VGSARRPPGLPTWGGRYAQQLTVATINTHGDRCHLCGTPGADTADHLTPRSQGGDDSPANLRPAHRSCNRARDRMPLPEWFATHPLPRRAPLPPSRDW